MARTSYPCPCCGRLVFDEPPGSYEICPICFWEDDPVQAADPWYAGGANTPSLAEAQRNFAQFGAMEQRFLADVRPPTENEELDPQWRPLRDSDRENSTTPKQIENAVRSSGSGPSYYYWLRG